MGGETSRRHRDTMRQDLRKDRETAEAGERERERQQLIKAQIDVPAGGGRAGGEKRDRE